ncbi:ATP-binding protein [Micromonospora aurantiaca]|uniref:ATP-binding protein n=1 Tax=Micromonospora aurantiaca (nom. illeg.) TaxID=47850 RepID=UPI000F3C93CB|nr:ATP-binding protein [Micromonospora aurantiaca]RNI00955.1 ATP-binding protein [Micromonospora aurantiaca]
MSRQHHPVDDLVVPSNFIRAVRESGYLSLSTALAELVDNSLQAGATNIAITIEWPSDALPEIVVEDNGMGMSKGELEACLRFGGSSRFDARQSFGRFGMGLPAASLSQARRVEVTTWRGGGAEHHVALDVDAVAAGASPNLTARRGSSTNNSASGCRVRWSQCDRIEYRRLGWLERSLHRSLGRIYRRFLASGTAMTINGSQVDPIDPMLLSAKVERAAARLEFQPLEFELETCSGETSVVTVRFAMLPVHRWHGLDNATKRRIGIVGQGGVSILRAGREIASGWHLMGAKRKENYDDWWRCEIEFEPMLDEHFGITINKQGVRPSAALREAVEPELESIARLLNGRVRQAFEEVKFQTAAQASCRIAAAADRDLPVIVSGRRGGALNYRIGSEPMPVESMFRSTLTQRMLDLTLNVDHPAFAALFRPLQSIESEAATELRTSLELFLLSFARSAAQMERSGQHFDDLLQIWSSNYGRMLRKS